MRVPPASMTFTLLLSFLVALPSFGIDMNLPALTAKGAALHVTPAQAGLMMSLFMLGFAVAPLFYGPASDRYGRKPRRGVRLHALYHRRDRLRICSVAADASDMSSRVLALARARRLPWPLSVICSRVRPPARGFPMWPSRQWSSP